MRDGFSRVDANLEVLDGWIDRHKAERNQMLDCLDSLERTIESLVEAGIEKDRRIEELQVQVQGMEDRLCYCGEMRQEEEEVECELHDGLPVLESTDEELEYANAEESEYHTPPVVQSPTLRLIHPELNAFGTTSLPCEECPRPGIGWCGEGASLVASPEENEIPLLSARIFYGLFLNSIPFTKNPPFLHKLQFTTQEQTKTIAPTATSEYKTYSCYVYESRLPSKSKFSLLSTPCPASTTSSTPF